MQEMGCSPLELLQVLVIAVQHAELMELLAQAQLLSQIPLSAAWDPVRAALLLSACIVRQSNRLLHLTLAHLTCDCHCQPERNCNVLQR